MDDDPGGRQGVVESVERALDVALLVMTNGGATVAVERAFQDVLRGLGVGPVTATWRLDLAVVRGESGDGNWSVLRPIGPIGVNLGRVSAATLLGERVARGEVSAAGIGAEVDRIETLAPSGNRLVMIAAAAVTAAAFSRIAGGDWGGLGVAFVAAGVGQTVRSSLPAGRFPVASVNLACGIVSAFLAVMGLRLGVSHTPPGVLLASVIYMVPGLPLINGFLDVISHRHLLVGLERIANAAFLFLVLTLAIAFAVAVT